MLRRPILTLAALALGPITLGTTAHAQSAPQPNGIQNLMFFKSFVQDHQDCGLAAKDGKITWNAEVASSPAATCPDAFAWASFAKVIKEEFWNWGIDQTVWPATPLPLCTASQTTECCDPNKKPTTEAEMQTCPTNRADVSPIPPLPAQMNGVPSHTLLHNGATNITAADPGRVLRDSELELVWRSPSMVDYIFRNNLYNAEGLAARNQAINTALGAGDFGKAHRLQVNFPVDSMMVKGDFIRQDVMEGLGLIKQIKGSEVPNNAEFPYVTIFLKDAETQKDTYFYMVSMTNASKDIPNWHWFAIEHVANKGRCDYIGCNDSFGYTANGAAQPGANFGSSFIPPKLKAANDLESHNDSLFDVGKVYHPKDTGETRTDGLTELFSGMGIATAKEDPDPKVLSPTDPAWMNYRLKGTQTEFTNATGITMGTGSTVTEGGFVNSSSCMTCHSQAGVDATASAVTQGVGATFEANLMGYGRVARGTPKPEWFYTPSPSVQIMSTDFVWGILGAHCTEPAPHENGTQPPPPWVCASYPADLPLYIEKMK